ncbi:MAG: hypothetical protein JJT78_00650 [Leptospira sp.]|nr:hypothetical protein [Leptospira sp.]
MSAIKMEGNQSDEKIVNILKNKRGEDYIELNLVYQGSGINIIESIKSGEIWDHAIVVLDNEGKEIGREPINFQAFTLTTVETIRTEKDEQFVLSEDGSLFGKESLAKTSKSSKVDPNFQHKSYTDKDKIPQIIKLSALPAVGTSISVFVELTYVSPFIDELCDVNSGKECPYIKSQIFKKVKRRNQLELSRLQSAIQSKVFDPNREKASNPKSEKADSQNESELKFKSLLSDKKFNSKSYSYNDASNDEYCNSVEACREEMKKEISKFNTQSESSFSQSVTKDGNRIYYREWNLVSGPRYFRVETINGVKKEAPKVEEDIIDLNESKKEQHPKIKMPQSKD